MSFESQNLMGGSSGKGRPNLKTKKSSSFQGNGQAEKVQDQNENLANDLLHQVSQKYLDAAQNYADFTSPQFLRELQMQQNQAKKYKSQQNSLRKEQGLGENQKNIQKMNNPNKKQASTVYGKSQGSNKYQSQGYKESQANKILQPNQVDEITSDQQQKQNYSDGYYHQPYTRLLGQKGDGYNNRRNGGEFSSSNGNYNFQKCNYNNSQHQQFLKQLETIIFTQVKSMQLKQLKGNYILQHITDDLQIQKDNHQHKINHQPLSPQELLKTRMHIQAIAKVMVFVHGKSEFRLVNSHYYIGEAYRMNGCYEQAIDHFTIALKKNTKLSEIKETKIYHSFILTALSECYFEIQMYEDALEILLRAYQIQQCYVNSELKVNNIKTIRLISECYLKMKNYRQAIEYMEKIRLIIEKFKGSSSKQYAQIKFEKAVIASEEGNRLGAIEQVKAAIELVQTNTTIEPFQKNMIILQYSKKLADFLENFGDSESQVSCLRQMLKIIDSQKVQEVAPKNFFTKHIIAIKKKIIVIAVRHSDFPIVIKQLQQVLQLEQEKYGSESLFVGKTLKMLGLVHLHLGNDRHAEEYFKRCYNLDKQSKDMKDQMRDLDNIFKSFGYAKRSSVKKNTMKNSGKKMSFS